jgi:hypothetical protein
MAAMQALREGVIGEVLVAKAWNRQRRRSIGRQTPSDPPPRWAASTSSTTISNGRPRRKELERLRSEHLAHDADLLQWWPNRYLPRCSGPEVREQCGKQATEYCLTYGRDRRL